MLGHTNTRMTLHYAHIMNESLAQEMNKVAEIIGGMTIKCSSVILVQYYGEGYSTFLVVF